MRTSQWDTLIFVFVGRNAETTELVMLSSETAIWIARNMVVEYQKTDSICIVSITDSPDIPCG